MAETQVMNANANLNIVEPHVITAVEKEQAELKAKWSEYMGFKGRRPVLHKKTAVLMLCWNPDKRYTDMDVMPEVNELRGVFEDEYGFKVTLHKLDTEKLAEHQAYKHMADFLCEEDSSNSLLIVYYAGHGGSEVGEMGQITLSGQYPCGEYEKKFDTIEWANVEKILLKTKADVLEIIDCCSAGLLCVPARQMTRCSEVLVACGENQRTPFPGPHSFTAALTLALKKLSNKPGFSTSELERHISTMPGFNNKQGMRLYGNRWEGSEEYIYIAPMRGDAEPKNGLFREERDEETRKEEWLDLRFHHEGPITDQDLRKIANAMRDALTRFGLKMRDISAVGKYNMGTHAGLVERYRTKWVLSAWSNVSSRLDRKTSVTSDAGQFEAIEQQQLLLPSPTAVSVAPPSFLGRTIQQAPRDIIFGIGLGVGISSMLFAIVTRYGRSG